MESTKRLAGALLVAISFGIAGGASANPAGTPDVLLPGGNNFLGGSLFEQFSFTGSFQVLASSTQHFVATPNVYSGTLFSEVIAGDTRNPFGGLDFVYHITVDSRGTSDGIHRITIDDFANVRTDVGFIRGTGERRPTSVDRSPAASVFGPGDGGDVIGWNYLPSSCNPLGCLVTPGTLARGLSSATLIVYTDAHMFRNTTAQFIDGGIAHAATFAPIPEPETYALMMAGLGLMGFVVKRRRPAAAS